MAQDGQATPQGGALADRDASDSIEGPQAPVGACDDSSEERDLAW